MSDCLERHHDRYRRLFDAVVKRGEADAAVKPARAPDDDELWHDKKVKPEEFAKWDSLHGEWLAIRSKKHVENEDEAEGRLLDREEALVLQMAAAPASHRWMIAEKIDVLEQYVAPAAEELRRTFMLPLLAFLVDGRALRPGQHLP